jgi:hypothetical protein
MWVYGGKTKFFISDFLFFGVEMAHKDFWRIGEVTCDVSNKNMCIITNVNSYTFSKVISGVSLNVENKKILFSLHLFGILIDTVDGAQIKFLS